MHIEEKIAALGYTLPIPSTPQYSYVPYVKYQGMVFISGQLPLGVRDIDEFKGQLGRNVSLEKGQEIARVCALNIVAQLKNAVDGDFNKVKQCLKLTVFVNSTNEFTDHPKVANGASDFIVELFGDKGKHSRAAVGVSQLPLGVAVEVEAIFAIVE